MTAMQSAGRLHVVHIGNELPKRYRNDKPGSPQTLVTLKRRNGQKADILVCIGEDEKSFRIVLDDAIHQIAKESTLEESVRRQQAAQSRRSWPENPEWWIVNNEEKGN